jgi:hypothetical protein
MSPTPSPTSAGTNKTSAAPVRPASDVHTSERAVTSTPTPMRPVVPKPTGYGMPCANCKTYYAFDLKTCPVCKSTERISPTAVALRSTVAAETCPDPVALEEERERFLREFKTQVFASQMPLGPGASTHCSREENHPNGPEPASVCAACVDHLQERVDVLEAALHMDIKEATQIIYDAVWGDTSDTTKTYENAAHAILSELRKRSGVTQVFGLMQPLSD